MNNEQLTETVIDLITGALDAMKRANLGGAMRRLNKARALLRAARACRRIDDDERRENIPPEQEKP